MCQSTMDMNVSQNEPKQIAEVWVIGSQVIFVDLWVVFVSLGTQQGHDGTVHYTCIQHNNMAGTWSS